MFLEVFSRLQKNIHSVPPGGKQYLKTEIKNKVKMINIIIIYKIIKMYIVIFNPLAFHFILSLKKNLSKLNQS